MQNIELQSIFTLKNIIIYFIIINIILFIITALGGGIGTIAGMYIFRHKTQKIAFVIGFPAITILEIISIVYFTLF